MRQTINKFFTVLAVLVMLVTSLGVTPIHADNELFKGYTHWIADGFDPAPYVSQFNTGSSLVSTHFPEDIYGSWLRTGSSIAHLRYDTYCRFNPWCHAYVEWHLLPDHAATIYYNVKVEFIHGQGHGFYWRIGDNGTTHTQDGSETGSFAGDPTNGNNFKIKFQSSQTGEPIDIEAMVYVTFSLDPNPAIPEYTDNNLPTLVYIDQTEAGTNEANVDEWDSRVQNYIDDVNLILAKTTSKQLDYTGHVIVVNSANDVFHETSETPCAENWNGNGLVKIFFQHDLGEDSLSGKAPGTDCDGYMGILINQSRLEPNAYIPYTPSDVATYLTNNGTCGEYGGACTAYWYTVTGIVHELEHDFGFEPEMYPFVYGKESFLYDEKVAVSFNHHDENNLWWNGKYGGYYNHNDFRNDPMSIAPLWSQLKTKQTIPDIKAVPELSDLASSYIDNETWVGQTHIGATIDSVCSNLIIPDVSKLTVTLKDGTTPIGNKTIKAWYLWYTGPVIGNFFLSTTSIGEETTNENTGEAVFDGINRDFICHALVPISYDIGILLKSYNADGTQYGPVQVFDTYNMQLQHINVGATTDFTVDMYHGNYITGNVGIANAVISYSGGETRSDENGDYLVAVPDDWSGTITPTKGSYTFYPTAIEYTNVTNDQSGEDYTPTFVDWVGGVTVTSDQNVVAVGRPEIGGQVMSYDGFPSGATTMYVPMLFDDGFDGSYDAAMYVQNVDSENAAITISYHDSSGNLTCTHEDTIPALSSKGYWMGDECVPAGWVGSATVTSDSNIVAVGRPHIGNEITSYNGFAAGNTTMYVPMLFHTAWGSYEAAMYVQNTDASNSASITVSYYNSSGSFTCSRTDTIPALSSHGYWIANECVPHGWIGGAVITANHNIVAMARPHIGSQITAYDGFAAGSLSATVPMMYAGSSSGFEHAALYIQNVDASNTASVTMNFYDRSGSLTCTKTDSIPPLVSHGFWLATETCVPSGWAGGVVITSNHNIVAIGRPHFGSEVFAYNGFPSGAMNSYVPMLFADAFGGGYDSGLYIMNLSGNTANITVQYINSDGDLTYQEDSTIAANAAQNLWVPTELTP